MGGTGSVNRWRTSLEEAIDLLDASEQPFVFFLDPQTGRGRVLYRRYEGHYGLLSQSEFWGGPFEDPGTGAKMEGMPEVSEFTARREALARRHLRPEAERGASTARGVHHIALICSDPDRTIEFYQGLLGFPLVEMFENRDSPGSMHFFFDIGHDNLLAFFDFPNLDLDPAVEAIGSLQHLALSVTPEQLDAAKARLDHAGIEYLGPERGVHDSIYFRDPDGIQIELTSQPLRGMPN